MGVPELFVGGIGTSSANYILVHVRYWFLLSLLLHIIFSFSWNHCEHCECCSDPSDEFHLYGHSNILDWF